MPINSKGLCWPILVIVAALASPLAYARILDGDQRQYLTDADAEMFSGTGRIECPIPGSSGNYSGTGWLAEANDTVATVSHVFYAPAAPPERPTEIRFDPTTCRFITYDRLGNQRDSVAIVRAWIKWDEGHHGDASHDLAVVKLARRPSHAIRWLPLAEGSGVANWATVTLVGFPVDVTDSTRMRKTTGKWRRMPVYHQIESVRDKKRMATTSVDSGPGMSGGAYVNDTGAIVGIHVKTVRRAVQEPEAFDVNAMNYNLAIMIDREFFDQITAMAKLKVP